MPCRDADPSEREQRSAEVAKQIIYVCETFNLTIPESVREAVNSYWAGNAAKLDEWTAFLCGTLRNLSEDDFNLVVYNARSRQSRDLANWWEHHQEEDRKREEQEKLQKAKPPLTKGFTIITGHLSEEQSLQLFGTSKPPTKYDGEWATSAVVALFEGRYVLMQRGGGGEVAMMSLGTYTMLYMWGGVR